MKGNIQLFSTTEMSREDWLSFRTRGLGASEVASVMGLSQYKSSIELFYDKLGQQIYSPENIFMFVGKEKEDWIANMWQYWEGNEQSMIDNYRADKIVRRCTRVNAYAINSSYPWLFVSLDRRINKNNGKGNGSLEIKQVSGWELDKWTAGFAPGYVVQIQTQILVWDYLYGESFLLKDGVHFECLPFDKHPGIQKSIISTTKKFWDSVLAARIALTRKYEAQKNFNQSMVNSCDEEIARLEPSPDGSQAYADFLKKKYQIAQAGERFGSDAQWKIAVDHKKVQAQLKKLEEKKTLYENQLKNQMKDGADCLTFGENGVVSWKNNSAGNRIFSNRIK